MVGDSEKHNNRFFQLSVLALSSRFDGLDSQAPDFSQGWAFSTRSVESF